MKKISLLFIFFFLHFIYVNAQKKSDIAGHIKYNFVLNEADSTKKKNEYENLRDQLIKQAKNVKFNLKFKGDISFFYVDDALDNDTSPMGVYYARNLIGKGHFYTDLKKKSIIRDYEALGEKFLISSKTKSLSDWTLTKESKMIGKYKCYKATTTKTIINPAGEFNFIIEAWYTPQIPVNFGVKEYNKLPGLILELKDTHYTFYAYKISLVKSNEIEIKPIKGKTITEVEYENKANKVGGILMLEKKN